MLGDALHNLRAALDHAYCILVEANGAPFSEWTRFPFGKDRDSLAGSINGHKKQGLAPSDPIIAAILDDIQPYESGKLGLYGLHRLDITDKHHILIPTDARMNIERIDIVDETGATTGGISGITFVHEGEARNAGFIGVGAGTRAVLHGDPKDVFQICFEKGQPFENTSILKTVTDLRANTITALSMTKGKA